MARPGVCWGSRGLPEGGGQEPALGVMSKPHGCSRLMVAPEVSPRLHFAGAALGEGHIAEWQ